jgi:hypothetical protein
MLGTRIKFSGKRDDVFNGLKKKKHAEIQRGTADKSSWHEFGEVWNNALRQGWQRYGQSISRF